MKIKSYRSVRTAYALGYSERFVVGSHNKPVTAAEQRRVENCRNAG